MGNAPTPLVLLNKRVSDRLNDTRHPTGSGHEPQWTPATVQRVLGAAAESILDCLANGEEVQLGRLGKFYPRVLQPRVVAKNFKDSPEKKTLPRRVEIALEPTTYALEKVTTVLALVEELTAESPEAPGA